MAVNMSVPEEQTSKDDLVELLDLRSAGKRAAGVFNLVRTIRLYQQIIVKYQKTNVHILRNYDPASNTVCVTKLKKPQRPL